MTLHYAFLAFLVCIALKIDNYTSASSATSDDGAFSCAGKVIGGYYADIQDNCQMFHVCTIGEKGEIRDIVFRCLNGTVFDQETRVCERQEEVDCSKTKSFFHLNNELYGPGIIPAGDQVDGALHQTLTHKDTQTPNRPKSDSDYETCAGAQQASLRADSRNNCKTYRVCLPTFLPQMMERSFICIDDGFVFDHTFGKCSRKVKCDSSSTEFPLTDEKKKLSVLDPLRFCSLVSEESFILDTLSDCEQFLQCPPVGNNILAVNRCPPATLFSQKHGSCIEASQVDCKMETYSLLRQLSHLERVLSEIPDFFSFKVKDIRNNNKDLNGNLLGGKRFRRGLTLENRNPHREATNGDLTNVAGVISDHASVIDAQNPGNILNEKFTFPEYSRNDNDRLKSASAKPVEKNGFLNNFGAVFDKDFAESSVAPHPSAVFRKEHSDSSDIQPQTSLAFNQTDLNGAVIEVSEIASPHKHGKVTITSIVPKFVRQNGNSGKKHRTSNEDTKEKVNGSKINLVGGAHHPFSPTDKHEATVFDVFSTTINSSQHTDSELMPVTENTTYEAIELEETTVLVRDAELEIQTTQPEVIESQTESAVITTIIAEVEETTMPTSTTTSPPTTSTTTTTATTSSTAEPLVDKPVAADVPAPPTTTNFTCKDKELEQFYPDIETNCKHFHYCSPGFTEDEVLDLTFVCSGETRFDIHTKKCQDINTVECNVNASAPTTAASSTTTTTTEAPTTTKSATTTAAVATTLEAEEVHLSTMAFSEIEDVILTTTVAVDIETGAPSARSDLPDSVAVEVNSPSVETKINDSFSFVDSNDSSSGKETTTTSDVDNLTDLYIESSTITEVTDELTLLTETPLELAELSNETTETGTELEPEIESLVTESGTTEIHTVEPSTESHFKNPTITQEVSK